MVYQTETQSSYRINNLHFGCMKTKASSLLIAITVGYFLAYRDIKRANKWTTLLIVFVMTLTFLNLIVVRGILVGLTEGSVRSYRERYTGDVLLSVLDKKKYIEDSHLAKELAEQLPYAQAVSARYISPGVIESEYKTQVRRDEGADLVNTVVVGIDPINEDAVTNLSTRIVAGRYLMNEDKDAVIVGVSVLSRYQSAAGTGQSSLKTADVGSQIRLTVNGISKEVTIVGVVKAKVTNIDSRVFIIDRELRPMMGRTDFNVNEIAIRTKNDGDDVRVTRVLLGNAIDSIAKIQTWQEAQPQFIRDISATFALLGDLIGSIGLAVASITIFIVIFVNAITRRKFIGILKGIGVTALAIEFSYIFQSVFYALSGSLVGLVIVYGVMVPYFARNPINFPFSDGIFVADVSGVLLRVCILFIATIAAGYAPARIVVKQKTLDAILGR